MKDQIQDQTKNQEGYKQQIDALKDKLRAMQAEYDKLKQGKNTESKNIDEISSKIESLKEELALKDERLLEKSSKIKTQDTEIEKQNSKIEDLTNKINQLSDGNNSAITKYIEENSSLKTTNQLLTDKFEEKDKQIKDYEIERSKTLNQIKNHANDLDLLNNEKTELKSQLKLYENQINMKDNEINMKDNEINEMKGLNT